MRRPQLPIMVAQNAAAFSLLFFSSVLFSPLQAQGKAEQAINLFHSKIPQEKLYVKLSQDQYSSGEKIWFKAYAFSGYAVSAISSNLYVELLDKDKKAITKELISLENGEGSGFLNIPEKLPENVYYVRAYTTWMLNFPDQFQFIQPVPIFNPSSAEVLVKDAKATLTASARPEGGNLINGLKTNVAVRLVTAGEPPKQWSGSVSEATSPDVKIAEFKSLDSNVALFSMTPETGKKYVVTLEDSSGNQAKTELPEVQEFGVTLETENKPESVKFTVKSKNAGEKPIKLYLIGTINSEIAYKATIGSKTAQDVSSEIPMKNFPNGILQLAVFDENEKLLASRLLFLLPNRIQVKEPALVAETVSVQPRGENLYNLSFSPGYLQYTVIAEPVDENENRDENSLLSGLYLTGDLSSKVFAPARYFRKEADPKALDALLMSEQWNRFNWNSLVEGKLPSLKYSPENHISYTGIVSANGKAAENKLVNLFFESPETGSSISQAITDLNGKFLLDNMTFTDQVKVSYVLNINKNEYVQVFFQPNNQFITFTGKLPASGYHLEPRRKNAAVPEKIQRYITSGNINKKVYEKVYNIEEIKLKGRKKDQTKELNNQLSSGNFRSVSEQVFDFVNEDQHASGYTNIIQWLQGRVAGMQVNTGPDGTFTPVIRGSKADIYLDEMPIDATMLSSVQPSNVAMVKVMKNFTGRSGSGNAIAIYTKRGNMGSSPKREANPMLNAGANFTNFRGYQKPQEFQVLNYKGQNGQDIGQDFRKVLYWNPEFAVPYSESADILFFNNDEAKKYKLTIMSMNKEDGQPLYYEKIVQ